MKIGKFQAKCFECNRVFNDKGAYDRHNKIVHRGRNVGNLIPIPKKIGRELIKQ